MDISVLIDEGVVVPLGAEWLRGLAEHVLGCEGVGSSIELGLVITGQERVQQLNRSYRGRDEPTDVLAFATMEEAGEGSFVLPPDGVRHIGEVIISYPQAALQAAEQRHSVEHELVILVIHGVLHLLGYDHQEPEGERRMKSREAEILSDIEGASG